MVGGAYTSCLGVNLVVGTQTRTRQRIETNGVETLKGFASTGAIARVVGQWLITDKRRARRILNTLAREEVEDVALFTRCWDTMALVLVAAVVLLVVLLFVDARHVR